MFKFLSNKIKRICVLGNQHGLLQYLLLSSLEEVDQTFFLFNYAAIPESVAIQFGEKHATIPKPSQIHWKDNAFVNCARLFFDYRICYPLRFPFLLNSKLEYWGHDHVYNSNCFFRNHPFRLLEDGLLNYVPYNQSLPRQRFLKIKRVLASKNHGEYLRYSGDEKNCIEIYLTGLSDEGEVLKDPKVRIKSFIDMWNDSGIEKQFFINNLFGVSPHMINVCKKFKHILLTQPFSEIGLLSEEEKINMYKQVLIKIGKENVAIKPHPLEATDYSRFFPNNLILNTSAPMQLLSLNGIRFESAYSVNSTALFDFPYKIKVCVLGSEIYPPLYKKRPEWTSDTVKITNKNVELIKL